MTEEEQLHQLVAQLAATTEAFAAERVLLDLLTRLLRRDGYEVRLAGRGAEAGFDFMATRIATARNAAASIGIELKHYRAGRPAAVEAVRALLGAAMGREHDRVMLISTTGFTKQAKIEVARDLPVVAELIDLDELKEWIRRATAPQPDDLPRIEDLIRAMSRRFAEIIARDPDQIAQLEWRDVERLVAEVFNGLGFEVTLTPPAKDGGKDVILECMVDGATCTYIVEVKHWKSSTRVGSKAIKTFLEVIARERREGGLFLSTYGYCDNAFSTLSEIERQRLRFGAKTKVVGLCTTYTMAASGIWSPPESLVDLLYEGTE
ncbi:MAG: restriction endonuclease [Polyangiaceae bacterium]|nr:restriction endonuclease [Polyangiaceae bacterium]